MPPRTGSQWDHKSDKDLLLAIIDSGALKGIDWKVISEKMTAKGYTFTHEACRQHFQKIRKESRNGSSDYAQSTPNKPRTSNGTAQKRSKGFTYEDGETADDEEILTPAKRAKVKAESKIKPEGQENGQSAELFKIEDLAGQNVIDLEQDDLYDEDECA